MAKKNTKKQLKQSWWTSPKGRIFFAVMYLGLAYVFVSLAIDSGSIWLYILTFVSLLMVLKDIFQAFKALNYGKK